MRVEAAKFVDRVAGRLLLALLRPARLLLDLSGRYLQLERVREIVAVKFWGVGNAALLLPVLRQLKARSFRRILPAQGTLPGRPERLIQDSLLYYEVRVQRIERGLRRLAAMGQEVTDGRLVSAMNTLRASRLRRCPSHSGQGSVEMYFDNSSRTIRASVSR